MSSIEKKMLKRFIQLVLFKCSVSYLFQLPKLNTKFPKHQVHITTNNFEIGCSSNDNDSADNLDNMSVEQILGRLKSFDKSNNNDLNGAPVELQEALNKRLQADEQPDWQIRLNLLGFTPLTYAGFALAAVILSLNSFFGTGWASRVLGIDDTSPFTLESISDDPNYIENDESDKDNLNDPTKSSFSDDNVSNPDSSITQRKPKKKRSLQDQIKYMETYRDSIVMPLYDDSSGLIMPAPIATDK